jgi:hypothetical protein
VLGVKNGPDIRGMVRPAARTINYRDEPAGAGNLAIDGQRAGSGAQGADRQHRDAVGVNEAIAVADDHPEHHRLAATSHVLQRRLAAVAEARRASKTPSVRAQARTPALFAQIRQPGARYLALPQVSSKNREYIPGPFHEPGVIAGNKLILWPAAPLWLFGYLQSAAFTAWVRAFSGQEADRSRAALAPRC